MVCVQAERRRAAEAAAEMEAAARAEAARLVLEKQLQQEADLQQVTCCPISVTCLPCLASVKILWCCVGFRFMGQMPCFVCS